MSDSATPWSVARQALLSMGFSRQEYRSGCHFLLQGIFLTQESNWGLLYCRQILYQLSYEGSQLPLPNSASCGTNIHNPPSYRPSSSCKPLTKALLISRALLGLRVPPYWTAPFPVSVFSSHPDSCSVIVKPWGSLFLYFLLELVQPWQVSTSASTRKTLVT